MSTIALGEDPAWRGLYRWSGLLLIVGLFLVLANIGIFATGPAAGTGTEGVLRYVVDHRLQFAVGSGVFAGLLLVLPAMLALYFALKEAGRARMLIGTAFGALGVSVFLYVLTLIFTLPGLGEGYVTAVGDAQRTAYVTLAGFTISQISSGLVVLTFLFSVWILLTSTSMLREVFPRWLGYLGLVAGMGFLGVGINIVFPTPGLDFIDVLSVLMILWLLAVGYRLWKLGHPTA